MNKLFFFLLFFSFFLIKLPEKFTKRMGIRRKHSSGFQRIVAAVETIIQLLCFLLLLFFFFFFLPLLRMKKTEWEKRTCYLDSFLPFSHAYKMPFASIGNFFLSSSSSSLLSPRTCLDSECISNLSWRNHTLADDVNLYSVGNDEGKKWRGKRGRL